MKSLVTLALVIVGLAACGGDKQDHRAATGQGPSAAVATPAAVLATADARTSAMCACADQPCRTAVASQPDDPFGEKARAARDGFSPDQRTQWNELIKRWSECSMRR